MPNTTLDKAIAAVPKFGDRISLFTKKLRLAQYADGSIYDYRLKIAQAVLFFNKLPEEFTQTDIDYYLSTLLTKNRCSLSFFKHTVFRLQAYYKVMGLKQPNGLVLPKVRKPKRTVIRQLKKQLIATRNLKGSMEALPFFDAKCKRSVEKTIAFLEKQIKDLEEDLANLACSEYKKQMDLLTSIKGIGVTLAAALIITTGGFTYFDNAKQLTRYLGLSPTYQQSGTSVNFKGHINRNGDSYLRGQLYVAAFSSILYNAECKACYERLRSKGKHGKVALIAAANKLIRQAFAVITQDKPYIDGYVSSKN